LESQPYRVDKQNINLIGFMYRTLKWTEYCSIHFKWEDIQPLYRPTGNGEYKWQYRVNKNKRSWE